MSLTSFIRRSSNLLPADHKTVRRMRYLMGTFVEIEATGKGRKEASGAVEAAFSEMKRVEHILSKYSEESLTSKINRFACSSPVKVTFEVFELIEESIRFSKVTNGAFDITVNPFLELLDLAQQRGSAPTREEIKQVSSKVGYTNVILAPQDKTIFFRKRGMKIDLGAVGKGHAIDKAIDVLKRNNIRKALVNAGGNIFCLDEDYSPIGIRNPLSPDEIIATIPLKANAISTSANYERSFTIQGKSYGHLIDAKTGYPVTNAVLSVSIISPSAKIADILSTAVFILGQHNGMQLIESMDDSEGIIITESGRRLKLHTSSGLKKPSPQANAPPVLTHLYYSDSQIPSRTP